MSQQPANVSQEMWCFGCRLHRVCELIGAVWYCPRGHFWPFPVDAVLSESLLTLVNRAMESHDCGEPSSCCLPDLQFALRKLVPELIDEAA